MYSMITLINVFLCWSKVLGYYEVLNVHNETQSVGTRLAPLSQYLYLISSHYESNRLPNWSQYSQSIASWLNNTLTLAGWQYNVILVNKHYQSFEVFCFFTITTISGVVFKENNFKDLLHLGCVTLLCNENIQCLLSHCISPLHTIFYTLVCIHVIALAQCKWIFLSPT